MTPKEMCDTCIHKGYCMAAYAKDHWCGNHTGREQVKWMKRKSAAAPATGTGSVVEHGSVSTRTQTMGMESKQNTMIPVRNGRNGNEYQKSNAYRQT